MVDSTSASRKKILFICGSLNQTTHLIEVAQHLGAYEQWYTPYSTDRLLASWRKLGVGNSVCGNRLRARCRSFLDAQRLPVDLDGKTAGNSYDLIVTCTDRVYPRNIGGKKVVVVQEGMSDPINVFFSLNRLTRYQKLCVASPGYRDYCVRQGIPPEKIAVTGIPNFDDCERYRDNDFAQRGYCLVCTSDVREAYRHHGRRKLIRFVNRVAEGRPIIFKLHPNERVGRAVRQIHKGSPGAQIYTDGNAEEMVANCDVLVCEYSSLAYIGLALGKRVYSYFDLDDLRRMMPLQNRSAARNIAAVCRDVLGDAARVGPTLCLVHGGAADAATPMRRCIS